MKKKIIVFLVLLCVFMSNNCIAQVQNQNLVDLEYEAKGVVPEWVKRITTPEEYEIWSTLSRYYRIYYPPIKYLRTYSDAEKKDLYQGLRNRCDRLLSGKEKVAERETFEIALGSSDDTLSAYREEILECKKKNVLLYTSLNGFDAHVELDLVYVFDSTSNQVTFLQHKVIPKSFSNLKVTMEEPVELKIEYYPKAGYIKGYCYVSKFKVVDAEGIEHKEGNVNVNFIVMP